jgi:hypothetical protein
MKLTYRGVSYDYNPPTVEFSNSDTVGKYRGLDIRFRNPKKVPVFQPTLDLLYRGVAYQTNPSTTVVNHAEERAVASVGAAVAADSKLVPATVASADDRARSLMMGHHRLIKQRQQVMLSRLATEVGLTAADASHYWNHIQGKVHPGFSATYDRSHVALS